MFKSAWDQRLAQFEHAMNSAKQQIRQIEKQTEALLARIVETTNESVIAAYEGKIADLEHTRLRLQQQAANYTAPTGTFEEKLEPALQFLANPWILWKLLGNFGKPAKSPCNAQCSDWPFLSP